MDKYFAKVEKATGYLKGRIPFNVEIAVILGSGYREIVREVEDKIVIDYRDIPGFQKSMIRGHKGEIVSGRFANKNVLIFNGRHHYYQGYSMEDVVLPVRVSKSMGIKLLIVTNASGGINGDFLPGDLMIRRDHINLMGNNPLIGKGIETFGEIFVDMSEPYDPELIKLAEDAALKNHEIGDLKEGVYLATTGPSYETKAEIQMFKRLGADAVGMSTVPEVIAANQEGLRVLGVSAISNMACGIKKGNLSHSEVISNMAKISSKILILLREIIKNV